MGPHKSNINTSSTGTLNYRGGGVLSLKKGSDKPTCAKITAPVDRSGCNVYVSGESLGELYQKRSKKALTDWLSKVTG